eukprot:s964_g10.t1
MPRWLLKTECGLQGFLRSILTMPRRCQCPTSKSKCTWPMAIPYPEAFTAGAHKDVRAYAKRLVSLHVLVFDWLHLGKPDAAPSELWLGERLSSRQWSVVRMLEHLAFDGNTPEFVDAAMMGRVAGKVEGFEESLAALSRAASTLQAADGTYYAPSRRAHDHSDLDEFVWRCGQVAGEVDISDEGTSKPLYADRLHFPPEPAFDPHPYFDHSTAELYDKPLTNGIPLDEVPKPPKVQVRASPAEKLKLFKKMAEAGLLKPLEPGSYLSDYRNGLFAVPKDAERDRMVLDGRPANLVDRGQTKWSHAMANAASLAGIYLKPENVLVCGGEDLRDYFYQFTVNHERTARNVLQGELTLQEARHVFGPSFCWPSSSVAIGLSSLAMGDRCAVEYAQCAHVALMLQHHVAAMEELLTLRGAIPRGLLHVGIIVDDLVVLEQVVRTQLSEDGKVRDGYESQRRLHRARAAYKHAKLLNNPKKGFEGELHANFWGVDVDGDKGLLRASQKRLWPCMVITCRICTLGLCTIGLLQSITGMWVSLLGVRRRLYSAMDVVFEPLMMDCSDSTVIRLSSALKSELFSLAVLGSLAVVNLRASYAPFVSATDSSGDVIAAVRAPIDPLVAEEVARHTLKKGIWTKLLPPGRALLRMHGILDAEEETPEDGYRTHPLWEVMARSLEYVESWRRPIRRPLHINVTELQAFVAEEMRIANSTPSSRVLSGLDSQVGLGTVVKGRAASPALNRVMQKGMCYGIGGDVYTLPMYFNTASNRADCPTRGSSPKPPDLPLPFWYDELAAGVFDGFDEWMAAVGAPTGTSQLPFEDLCGSQDLDLRPAACEKRGKRREQQRSHETSSMSASPLPRRIRAAGSLSAEAREFLLSFPRAQFFFAEGVVDCLEPGGLDLFSGNYGVAKQMLKYGAPWVLTFEWQRSASEDLLAPVLREKLRRMIALGCFKTMGAAPICSSFSVAVTPPVRSCRYPRGIPGLRRSMQQKVKDGNSHSDFVRDAVDDCELHALAYFVENPDCSWWWRQRRWRRWRSSSSSSLFRCCFCRFGTPWRKATRFATNTRLSGCRMMCTCKQQHQRLRGGHPTRKIPWTLVAQPYPRGLCRLLAVALCQAAGWCRRERLNVAACSKTGNLRAGEAKNPGPRRRAPVRPGMVLAQVQLISGQTLALEARLLQSFCIWCSGWFGNADLEVFFSCAPKFLADALEVYAEWLYNHGGALSNLRHLILACQRWVPASRTFMSAPWDMVERWELMVPVRHRTPVPLNVVNAMCVYAWHLKWYSWVGATLLAFYGAGRLGEVLKCRREDLVLPEDVFEQLGSPVFLRLRSFKSKLRQPAKVQHMKVADPVASKLLTKIFKNMDLEEPLFGVSAYQYRKRWDQLLCILCIPSSFQLTPGGLRGGAAVYHYKNGKAIQDLLWLLRLRSQTTLESYLQEVAALNLFARLPPEARACIKNAADTFAFLVPFESSGEALSAFLEFLYKGTFSVKKVVLPELLRLVHQWEVQPLQSALNELLVKHMTPELCSSLIVDCEVLLVDQLDEMLECYVLENFGACVKTEQFGSWPLHRMIGLLRSDDLVAEHEEEVLAAVMHWHRSGPHRDDATAALLQMVRFPLLSAEALQGLGSREGLTGLPGVVMSRLAAAALKIHQGMQSDLRERPDSHEEASFMKSVKRRNSYPHWWADFGCSLRGGVVIAERSGQFGEGELEPWAVHIHDQSLYIIDGREPCCVLQWPLGAPSGRVVAEWSERLFRYHRHRNRCEWGPLCPGRTARIRDGVGEVVGDGCLSLDVGTRALYIGSDGSIYFIDEGGSRVQRYYKGITAPVAGGADSGDQPHQLEDAEDIFVTKEGVLYVSDSGNNRIQKWLPGAHSAVTVAGGNGKGSRLDQLQHPVGLHDSTIYIADYQNHRVMKWKEGWQYGLVVAGGHGVDAGKLKFVEHQWKVNSSLVCLGEQCCAKATAFIFTRVVKMVDTLVTEMSEDESLGSEIGVDVPMDVVLEVAPGPCQRHTVAPWGLWRFLGMESQLQGWGELLLSMLSISLSYRPWKVTWLFLTLPLLAAAFRCQLSAVQYKQSSSSVEEQQLYQIWLHGASCLSAMLQVCLMCFVPAVTEDSWDIVPSAMCFVLLNIGAWTSVAAARSLQEHVVSDKSSAVALQLPVDMEPVDDVIDVSVAETELEEICSICLRPLATEPLRRLHCGHAFHQGCIDAWLRTVTRGETRLCPMRCENPVQVRTAPPVTAPGAVHRTARCQSAGWRAQDYERKPRTLTVYRVPVDMLRVIRQCSRCLNLRSKIGSRVYSLHPACNPVTKHSGCDGCDYKVRWAAPCAPYERILCQISVCLNVLVVVLPFCERCGVVVRLLLLWCKWMQMVVLDSHARIGFQFLEPASKLVDFSEALCFRILRLAAVVEDQSVLMISVMNGAGVSGAVKPNKEFSTLSKSSRKYPSSRFPASFT